MDLNLTTKMASPDVTSMGLGDSVYNRLLKERIIWLGGEVKDENANQIVRK